MNYTRKRGAPYLLPSGKLHFHPTLRVYTAKSGRKQCPKCGTYFKLHPATKRFCSVKCRNATYAAARPADSAPLPRDSHYDYRMCASCHKPFARAVLNQVTCSTKCARALAYTVRLYRVKYPDVTVPAHITVKRCKALDVRRVGVVAAYRVAINGHATGRALSYDAAQALATAAIVHTALLPHLGAALARLWAHSLRHGSVPWLTIGPALDAPTAA